jgi:hypothetical protein
MNVHCRRGRAALLTIGGYFDQDTPRHVTFSELCFGDSLARLSKDQPRILRDERPVLETSTPHTRNAHQIGHVVVKHAHSNVFWVQFT